MTQHPFEWFFFCATCRCGQWCSTSLPKVHHRCGRIVYPGERRRRATTAQIRLEVDASGLELSVDKLRAVVSKGE